MSKSRLIRFSLIFLLALWMIVIFIMSSQPANQSSQVSGGIVSKIIAFVYRDFDALDKQYQESVTDIITVIVRKTAHFLEFFILGLISCFIALTYKDKGYFVRIVCTVFFCVIYAISDEFHQCFVPGRAGKFGDVCIDSAGSILAILLLIMIENCKKRRRLGELDAKKAID